MPTYVQPLPRIIRIRKQRQTGTWRVTCPCCWGYYAGFPDTHATFDDARNWTIQHIEDAHQPCTCTDNTYSCGHCNPWPDTYEAN